MQSEAILSRLIAADILPEDEWIRRLGSQKGDYYAAILEVEQLFPHHKRALGRIWADVLGVAYVDLETTLVQPSAARQITEVFARENEVIPLYEFNDTLTLAAANPLDRDLIEQLHQVTGRFINQVFAFPREIEDAISITYLTQESLTKLIHQTGIQKLNFSEESLTEDMLRAAAGNDTVIQFTKGLLLLALHDRASDIHIEPREFDGMIRFRVDGVLQERFRLSPSILFPIVARLKVLSKVDITERRRPQDGRMALNLANRTIDLRFSSVPSVHGEKIVLRILGQIRVSGIPDLSELNMSESVMLDLKRAMDMPNGIFFVTGPTGSGKSTTLYSIINRLNTPDINIVTIEDPVEYRLNGVNQTQVKQDIGYDFSSALRSFLRQDPDVILVGEIRDAVSARIAAQAALTGHLVFTTMHTNNSLQAVTRLIEIGVEPYLVAPSIIGVMAQRLVRRICSHCKVAYPAPRDILDANFMWDETSEISFYRGKGCEECRHSGFLGRVGVHEIFYLNEEVRSLIVRNASILEIEACARKSGFKPLRHDGLKKVLRGLTTIREIDNISYS